MTRAALSQVSPNIYCVRRRSYFSCSYIVLREADVVLIDAGMKSDASDMLGALADLAVQKPVTSVLLTHWHNDHAAGARRMQELGSKIYAARAEFPFLNGQSSPGIIGRLADLIPESGPLVLMKGLLGNRVMACVQPDAELQDGETIAGDFQTVLTPGHTEGHASFFHLPSQTLFCGDALAVIKGRIRFMARPVTPDLASARASMKRMADIPFRALCPGHREPLMFVTKEQRDDLKKRAEAAWPLFG